jgi:hypothetical protein
MSGENSNLDGNNNEGGSAETKVENETNLNLNADETAEPIKKLVDEKVKDAVKDIKVKLEKAYGARDEALKKLAEIESFRKQEEVKRLQEEGKHKEALEMQLAEERAQKAAYEKRVIELTRDMELRGALSSYTFKNDNAFNMAYREIVEQLAQDDKGIWRHKSGVSLRDFVRQFAEAEENAFLLKPKISSGSGGSPAKPNQSVSSGLEGKSIFSLPQDEVLKMAREGRLAKR